MTHEAICRPRGLHSRLVFSGGEPRAEHPHHGRHGGGHGPGPRHGRGPGFGPGGRHERGPARRRRGDVRLAALLLLADEPRNGYQLMQAIEGRTAGRWRPSPGSVYPTLAQLEDEGLIRTTERAGVKVFELTEAGREQVGSQGQATGPWEQGGGSDAAPDATGGEAGH